MNAGRLLLGVALAVPALGLSCAHLAPSAPAPLPNPFFVPANNPEVVWERAVDVLHEYPFYIERESRLDGIIETEYKVGSGVLEPWHKESIGCEERVESTLQSIRRRVRLTLTPQPGGFLVGVEAIKELEDAAGPIPAGAPFAQAPPFEREAVFVGPEAAPTGWIPLGRDLLLEQDLLARLHEAYTR